MGKWEADGSGKAMTSVLISAESREYTDIVLCFNGEDDHCSRSTTSGA